MGFLFLWTQKRSHLRANCCRCHTWSIRGQETDIESQRMRKTEEGEAEVGSGMGGQEGGGEQEGEGRNA